MLTSLREHCDIYFNVQAKGRSVHINGYCDIKINIDTDCCIGQLTKISYISSYKEILFSNLAASQKHREH